MKEYDCIVVGSGINSLVCAALLARKRNRVLVLERNAYLGGCILTEELTLPGFKHDVLSSWHPLFLASPAYAELKDELEARGLQYCHVDTPTGVALDDNRYFVLHKSRQTNIDRMNELAAGDGGRYQTAMAELEQTLDLSLTLLGGELWSRKTAMVFLKFLFTRGPHELSQFLGFCTQTCRHWLESTFESSEIRACLAPWVLHAGLGPESVTSGYIAKVIALTLEMAGCPVVQGGSENLVRAFEKLICDHDGELMVDTDVERVCSENGIARSVLTTDGSRYHARKAVICNVTPAQLYQRLLDPADVPEPVAKEARAFRHGTADMQIHLALNEPPEWKAKKLRNVALVHITDGLDCVSKAINEAQRCMLPAAGTIAVGQPAVVDPTRAPKGKGLLWIQMQDLPSVVKGDAAEEIVVSADGRWNETVREAYADRIVARLSRHINGLKENIIGRVVLSPADLEAININLSGGDPYGGDCSLDQFFLWRPLRMLKNHSTPLKNLYHIGASTHPGPGLAGGSGYLVGQKIK